tara:strand:+ start:246 stop:710 length:465 start_codon:yes stop_codon:yes gene_type:complete
MTYVIIRNGPPKGARKKLTVYTSQFGNPKACCICITELKARVKAAGLARDYVAEMVKDGTLDNCMEVNITEDNRGFELYHGCECGDLPLLPNGAALGHDGDCDGVHICSFTVSEVNCFDPPELEVKVNVNSGQFGDAVQPGDAAFYKKEGDINV